MKTIVTLAALFYMASVSGGISSPVPWVIKFFVGLLVGAAFFSDMRDAFGSRSLKD